MGPLSINLLSPQRLFVSSASCGNELHSWTVVDWRITSLCFFEPLTIDFILYSCIRRWWVGIHCLHPSSHLRLSRLLLCPFSGILFSQRLLPWLIISHVVTVSDFSASSFLTHIFELGAWGQNSTQYSDAVTLWIFTVASWYFLFWSPLLS